MNRVERYGLQVDAKFAEFIEYLVLPGTDVEINGFWRGLSEIVKKFSLENTRLLERRSSLQSKIDQWHLERKTQSFEFKEYLGMLHEIGYIVPEVEDYKIETQGIDPEIATIAGPQLVVPITNARFAVNAANARWNSIYDALYGSDALGSLPPEGEFDSSRGNEVISWTKDFLDQIIKLNQGSHSKAIGYEVKNNQLWVKLEDGSESGLVNQEEWLGYTGEENNLDAILFCHHDLHVEIQFDHMSQIGSEDAAGISDILLESAVTTIMDFEDSVSVVDAADKILAYKNWLGLMTGTLDARVSKGGQTFTRRLNPDREYKGASGDTFTRRGLSLLLVRNVGLLMKTPVILDDRGEEIYEGLLDAMCTVLISLHDIRGNRRNSPSGSIYVVKPKLHGPEEAGFTDKVFTEVEHWLGLPQNTVKIGIMDEERRTTVNLKECIKATSKRVAFINTGFLDRTGDEIHTSMEAGPFLRKQDIKTADWLSAYEDWNTEVGIACGLPGSGQIGKGMWAMPDLMHEMIKQKIEHPLAGANTSWVPSPTAAVLHATHYHLVNVAERQEEIRNSRRQTNLNRILSIPLAHQINLSDKEILEEVENNLQGILGYVVRWVDQGVGCSKVPDLSNVQLMEDRATCRISSQHIANWLHHGIVDKKTVESALRRMALVVDQQNKDDPQYKSMGPNFEGHAFKAARMLVFEGRTQPSGYTEPILHHCRHQAKQQSELK